MLMVRKYFLLGFLLAILALAGCAEVEKSKISGTQSPVTTLKPQSNWRIQAEQLENRGDYGEACRLVRKHYLKYYDAEAADYFTLLLSYLGDKELADWWTEEEDKGLSCRIGAEYFFRLKMRPEDELSDAERVLLLDLARLLSSGCEVSEDVRNEAESYLSAHQKQTVATKINIGCLLPLSGPNAVAGERFLRGMEIALGVYPQPQASSDNGSEVNAEEQTTAAAVSDAGASAGTGAGVDDAASAALPAAETKNLPGLRVFFYDTAGDGEQARAGVNYLVNEKKVDLILGPYTEKAANYAAAEAQSLGVTMVSLSPLLYNLGRYPNVFQHYPTIRNQAVSLAELARVRLGFEKFALLVPQNRYGREFAEKFSDKVKAWGGQVVRQVEYDSGRPDFGPAIRELIGEQRYRKFKAERKAYEVWSKARQRQAARDKAAAAGSDAANNKNQLAVLAREIGIDDADLNLDDEILPRPLLKCDFEAIVIPDREQTLKLLIPQLAFYDLDECFLLGGRYWNKAEFLTSVADYAEGAYFVGVCLPPRTEPGPGVDSETGETVSAAATVNKDSNHNVSSPPDLAKGATSAEIQARFQAEFAALYQGKMPGLLEIYGFETIMLLRQLAVSSPAAPDAETWRQLLAACQNIPLAAGLANTLPDGEIATSLYPLTLQHGRIGIVAEGCF